MNEQATASGYVVNLPLGPSHMTVGPFATEDEANDFANTWLECVDVPREQVSVGPCYPPSVVRDMLADVWPEGDA